MSKVEEFESDNSVFELYVKDIKKYPILSSDEISKLIVKAQAGDIQARNRVIESNLRFVISIAKRFQGRGYENEELYQIACIGFIKSIKRFNIDFNVKLSTYAVPFIIGEIKRFIRDDGPIKISRSLKELSIKIKEIQREYLIKNGEEIGIKEIAKKLKTSEEKIIEAIDSLNPIESINEEIYENNSKQTKINTISNGENEEEKLVNKLFLKNLIQKLNSSEKQIVLLRYFKNKTQTEVAKILRCFTSKSIKD